MITEAIKKILRGKVFVYVATADLDGKPSVAPKFLVKIDKNFLYLADYVIGKTLENLKINPAVSVSFMDNENLMGYKLDGAVTLVSSGPEFDAVIEEVQRRKVSFTAERVIQGVQRGKRHDKFEVALPDRGIVFKVKVEEVTQITAGGELKREKI